MTWSMGSEACGMLYQLLINAVQQVTKAGLERDTIVRHM